jgi:peptide/nickel transport system permease protein
VNTTLRIRQRPPLNGLVGVTLIGLMGLMALVSLIYTPYDPVALDFTARLVPPSVVHWFGTDDFGRDVFSRTLAGAATSAGVSAATVVVALLFGTVLGGLAGYFGGTVDRMATIFIDAVMSIPALLLALGIMAAIGPTRWGVVMALGCAYTPTVARVVRGQVLTLRSREFVEASRVLGNSDFYTLLRHVAPNCVTPLTVIATAIFGHALLAETALSFLGLGVPPPAPTWGGMMADARGHLTQAPWMCIFPGIAVSLSLLGINLAGDALRDRLDPRLHRG